MATFDRPRRLAAVALAGGIAFVAAACEQGAPPAPPPPGVEVAEVLVETVPIFAEYVGQTDATANVEVKARVEGFVEEILFEEGTFVEQGQALFRIEKEPIEQRLHQARAQLAEAEAALDKARADIDRYAPLVEARAIPRQDLENAEAAERSAVASVAAAKAGVRSAELDVGYTDVIAPVTGLIGARDADIGSLVGGLDSSLLATISPLDPIWFNANVSEVEYLEATRYMKTEDATQRPLTLLLPDGTEHPEIGYFVFVDRTIDPRTGTLRVRAEFANPDDRLRPGMFGRVRILLTEVDDVILVPQRAIQEIQGTYSVFKVGADGIARFTRVEPGPRVGSLWTIRDGLAAGDRVIVEGLLKARDGEPVTPTPTTIDPAPLEKLRERIPKTG